jgi:predicted dehydrogenase
MRSIDMKVGLIGIGQMGKNHLRILKSLKNRIDSITIFDTDKELLHQLAAMYEVEHCHSIFALLEAADAVIIATPTSSHYELAEKCLMDKKDVFIEKPITATVDEAMRLNALVGETGRICMVGHVERFNPVILHLREYLKDKEIMHISSERISKLDKGRSFDVDVIVDLMIHDIDIILSIVDSKPSKVFAASCDSTMDIAQAALQFENGIVAAFSASRSSSEKIRRMSVFTRDESIKVDFLKYKVEKVRQECINVCFDSCSYNIVGRSESIILEGEPLYLELKHFLDCVQKGEKPISNEENGLAALRVAEAMVKYIYESR